MILCQRAGDSTADFGCSAWIWGDDVVLRMPVACLLQFISHCLRAALQHFADNPAHADDIMTRQGLVGSSLIDWVCGCAPWSTDPTKYTSSHEAPGKRSCVWYVHM